MGYNKEELIALPAEEKIALAEELWSSVENNQLPVTSDEIEFAKERLKLAEQSAQENSSLTEFKKHFTEKYGF